MKIRPSVLLGLLSLVFFSFTKPATADVFYWSFSGSGSCGLGPGCSNVPGHVNFFGGGSLTTGNLDGPGYDITSFTGAILYESGFLQSGFVVNSAVAYSGAFIFDPTQDLLVHGLILQGITCQSNACFVIPLIGGFNDAGGGVFSFSETPTAIPAVPESSTWAMLLIGFTAIGLLLHVRRERLAHEMFESPRKTQPLI
jgi:hypothetical protein